MCPPTTPSAPASDSAALPAPPCVDGHDPVQWFNQEVHPHENQLKAYLRSQFPSVRDVDDVVQESFLKIWKARAGRPIESARAFLFRIAQRLAIDVVRRARRSPVDAERSADDSLVLDNRPNAVEILLTRETLQLLAQAIAQLPPKERAVILLHKVNGLAQREAAEKLNFSVRSVEKYTIQGLRRCQGFLAKHGIEHFFD